MDHRTSNKIRRNKKLLTNKYQIQSLVRINQFYAMCGASKFGIGAEILQSHSGTNKMSLISANSRLFTQAELRLSTLMRECTAITYTLTEYKFLILDLNIQQFYLQIINLYYFSLHRYQTQTIEFIDFS